jgi:hypothetical protein
MKVLNFKWMEEIGTCYLVASSLHSTQVIGWHEKSISNACLSSQTMAHLFFCITLAILQFPCIFEFMWNSNLVGLHGSNGISSIYHQFFKKSNTYFKVVLHNTLFLAMIALHGQYENIVRYHQLIPLH